MNGPEHYREAERLLSEAVSWDVDERQVRTDGVVIAAAQVHATLALAAATVEQIGSRGPGDITREWSDIVWPDAGEGVPNA